MTRGTISLWSHTILLSLPAVAMCALGWRMLSVEIPRAEASAKNRLGREYRQIAVEMAKSDNENTIARGKGWRQSGKIGGSAWGHKAEGAEELIWVGVSGDVVKYRRVEREVDIGLWSRAAIIAAMLISVLLTIFCLRYFRRYARERDEFLAAALHDLRTPLAGLQLSVGRNADEAKRVLEIMRRRIENLKEFMRLGGKRPVPHMELLDLKEVFLSAYAVFREDFRELFDGEDLPLRTTGNTMALADLSLVTQLIWNLLSNSLKYAAPYGRVEALIEPRDGKVVLQLADQGPGLSARDRRRAFKRYFRAASAVSSAKGGFGIGLTVARDFARQMGGDLTLAPNQPHGCVFSLSLQHLPNAV